MSETKKHTISFFWFELVLTSFIPFIVWWSLTPTNILNSSFLFGLLEIIGLWGSTIIFFAGIPLGICGICKAKNAGKFKIPMIVLSIVNLSVGIFEVAILILIFYKVAFCGLSV